MNDGKPILKWALRYDDGRFDLYETRSEARFDRDLCYPKPSVVRVQITVLKDRK